MVKQHVRAALAAMVTAAAAGAAWGTGETAAETSRRAADAVWRAAVLDLRLRQEPLERDYRLAGRMLDAAQAWAPDDVSLARERVEAWYQAGDLERTVAACRDVLRADPADTVTQLRLITSEISRRQTAEERLAMYERFLGPGGQSLDPAVRSRLALDAALMLRERGDVPGFVDRLSMATSLDPTNKEAAALAYTFYASQRDDPAGQLEMLSNLLLADPIDASVHQTIGRLLGEVGAFKQSRRFYDASVAALYAAGITPDQSVAIDQLILRWHDEGPASVVQELNLAILTQRDMAMRTIQQLDRSGIPSTGVTPPSELRLPVPLEQIRLLAADAAGDAETKWAAAADLEASVQKTVNNLAAQGSAGMIPMREAISSAAGLVSELLVVTALTDSQTESIRASMAAFIGRGDVDIDLKEQLTPWVDLRQGRVDTARDKFLALDPSNLTGRLGLAMCDELSGNHARAREGFAEIAQAGRMTVLGVWARGRVLGTEGSWGDDVSPERDACARVAEGIPRWLDEMVRDPRAFMSLSAEVEPTLGESRPVLRLTLRNLSPLPLAVGPDSPINSRMLISPRVEFGLRQSVSLVLPEVMDADTRLRLRQGEAVEIQVWPDLGFTGWLIETNCLEAVRTRWGVLQGFISGRGMTYRQGPHCLATQTEQHVRKPLRPGMTVDEIEAWLAGMGGPDGSDEGDVYEACLRLRGAAMLAPEEGGLPAAEVERLARAAAGRYPALKPDARIVALGHIPHAGQAPALAPFDEAARQERDPQALRIALVTRGSSPDSPLFAAAMGSGDPSLVELARLIRERLEAGEPAYATVAAGLKPLAGPGLAASGGTAIPTPASQP